MIFRSSHIISLLFLTLIINAQKAPNNSFIIYGGIAHIGNGEIIPKSIIGIDDGTISSTIAKNIFSQLIESKMDVDELIKEQGLEQISDTTEIEQIVITVLKEHQEQKDQYLAGKEQVLGFLIGKVMQKTQGKANPKLVNDLMVKILSNN